jgi:hypothetical protein
MRSYAQPSKGMLMKTLGICMSFSISLKACVHEDIKRSARIRQSDENFHKTIFIRAGRP